MSKLLILLKNGHEEVECLTMVDYLRRAGIQVDMLSLEEGRYVKGAHDIIYKTDLTYDDYEGMDDYDGVFMPGGVPSMRALQKDERAIHILQEADKKGKMVVAICAAPAVLETAGLLKGKTATSFPGFEEEMQSVGEYSDDLVVQDGNLITSRGPATAVFLALKLVELMKGKEARDNLDQQILQNLVREK